MDDFKYMFLLQGSSMDGIVDTLSDNKARVIYART